MKLALALLVPCALMAQAPPTKQTTPATPAPANKAGTTTPAPAAKGAATTATKAPAPTKPATPAGPKPNLLVPSTAKAKAPDHFKVKFTTTKGDFLVQVTREWAPLGADRFYNLVRAGFFTDVAFFRVLPGFVAQFGLSPR